MTQQLKSILNNPFDISFIYFPMWFPISYIFLVINIPSAASIFFIFSLFLFAETHFASTWLFFFDRDNKEWIKKNSYILIVLPIYIITAVIGIWFFNPNLIILLHYLASGFHVTRQSIGISKLSINSQDNFHSLIYFFSFGFLATGLLKPGILNDFLSQKLSLNIFLLIVFISYIFLIYLSSKGFLNNISKYIFSILTGIMIYLPILFFKDLSTATAVGVGMHWIQYIALFGIIYFRKTNIKYKTIEFFIKSNEFKSKISFIFMYALIMTLCAYIGVTSASDGKAYTFLYLIPIIFQLYHFYIDGFIWRFSDKHLRKSIASFLKPS